MDYLYSNFVDICGVNETWLLPNVPDYFVQIPDCKIMHIDANMQLS